MPPTPPQPEGGPEAALRRGFSFPIGGRALAHPLYINGMLEILDKSTGAFILDERAGFRPAGLGRFAKSKGGHLHDDPRDQRALTIQQLEGLVSEFVTLEMGMVLQNLALMTQALGLGTWRIGIPTVEQRQLILTSRPRQLSCRQECSLRVVFIRHRLRPPHSGPRRTLPAILERPDPADDPEEAAVEKPRSEIELAARLNQSPPKTGGSQAPASSLPGTS